MDHFAQWLDITMSNHHLKGKELARELGVHDSAVSRWRNGSSVPTMDALMRLAKLLDEDPIRMAVTAGLMDGEMVDADPLPLPPPEARRKHVREQIKAIRGLDKKEMDRLLETYDTMGDIKWG
jgi:transcriptional regulator with XRE-family HTH domain